MPKSSQRWIRLPDYSSCPIPAEPTHYRFIELMRPKVEMLTRWEQDPDGTREAMKGFQELMERLRTEHPDDPREALDALLAEMVSQQKKAQQPPGGDVQKAAPHRSDVRAHRREDMRHQWSQLNNLQKGSFGEHFAKMEFAMFGLWVFSSEVDDRGIDFVARTLGGKHHDVQVKTITGNNYTYVSESKFSESLLVCLVVLIENQPPTAYLFRGSDWAPDTHGLLARHHYPNAKEPEYGIHCSAERQPVLNEFALENAIKKILT